MKELPFINFVLFLFILDGISFSLLIIDNILWM